MSGTSSTNNKAIFKVEKNLTYLWDVIFFKRIMYMVKNIRSLKKRPSCQIFLKAWEISYTCYASTFNTQCLIGNIRRILHSLYFLAYTLEIYDE